MGLPDSRVSGVRCGESSESPSIASLDVVILEPMLGEKRPADDEMVDLLPASYQENTRYRASREDGMRPWVRSVVFVVLAVLIAKPGLVGALVFTGAQGDP